MTRDIRFSTFDDTVRCTPDNACGNTILSWNIGKNCATAFFAHVARSMIWWGNKIFFCVVSVVVSVVVLAVMILDREATSCSFNSLQLLKEQDVAPPSSSKNKKKHR